MGSVGKAIPHESARGHVTGAALYTDDLAPRFHGLVHAWPVLAPHAHARVAAIRVAPAMSIDGVVTVLTADDVPGENDTGCARRDEPLFPSEVCFHGQAVAWVLAETEEAARQASLVVEVDYDPLEPVLGIEAAIARDSYHTDPLVISRGDAKAAIEAAYVQLEGELAIGGQEHFYLETQASIAYYDEDGHLFVHSSTQHPAETQEICARVLGVSRAEVTCQSLRMGGAFGGKEVQANPYAAVAAVGAHKLRRPVRVRLDRQRDMVLTGKRHPFLARFRAGFSTDGRIAGLAVELFSDGGWSKDLSEPVLFRAMFHIDNAYYLPAVDVVGRVCKTHTPSATAFRGFGGPQGMVVIEEVLDRAARILGLPPHTVRARNLYEEGQHAHYGQVIRDASRIRRIWDALLTDSDFDARWAAIPRFNEESAHRKRGLAITPVKFGISFTTAFFNQAGALVLVYKDGSVQLNHGGTEMGQGLHTKMMQIAADALGVPIARIRIMPTRTDKVPNTSATAASSGSDLNGAAVKAACDTLRERLAEVAGRMLSCPPDDLVFEEGRVFPFHRRDGALELVQVCEAAYLDRVPLFATGYYRTPHIHFDAVAGRGKPFHYYAYGAAVAEVEVDAFTGQYRLLRADILHDCGESMSPLVDRGQVEGGFIQGVGWLTTEELVWDPSGRLATRGASTYKLPSLGECPPDLRVSLLPKAAEAGVVHGSKAVGEPPFMLAFSVREALRQAVAAFGPAALDSARVIELGLPSTPEAVYWAIERVRASGERATRAESAAAE
jgi:xanthine dehydrogenase large subunit